MAQPTADLLAARHARVRAGLGREGLDALVVFHLPNIRYLTGFAGSTAIAVLGRDDIALITDGRYVTEVETRVAPGCPGLRLLKVDPTYDATLAAFLRTCDAPRVGFESAHVTVKRFDTLTAALRDTPSRQNGAGALIPAERVVEAVEDSQGRLRNRDVPPRGRPHQRGRPRGGRRGAAGAARVGGGGGHRRPDPPWRVRAPVVRYDRRVGTQRRPPARAAGGPPAAGRRPGRAGLRGRLRRILRGYHPHDQRRHAGPRGQARLRRGRGGADGGHPGGETVRRRDRRRRGGEGGAGSAGARARLQPRDRARPGTRDSRGAAGGAAAGRHSRRAAGRARRPARTRAWCSPSNRARTCRVSAGCASKTMCS